MVGQLGTDWGVLEGQVFVEGGGLDKQVRGADGEEGRDSKGGDN